MTALNRISFPSFRASLQQAAMAVLKTIVPGSGCVYSSAGRLILLVAVTVIVACNSAGDRQSTGAGGEGAADNGNNESTNGTGAGNENGRGLSNAGNFREGVDYQLFDRVRVLDKRGFSEPAEAYSLLLPKGWKQESEIIWNGPGSGCDGTNQWIRAVSPDGKYSLDFLPMLLWSWSSNAGLRQMQQQTATPSDYCSYGEPMTAEQYLRNQMLRSDLHGADIRSVGSNDGVIAEMSSTNDKARRELMSYGASDVQFRPTALRALVDFPDGKQGIVLCSMNNIETTIPNMYTGSYDHSYTSQATQRIVFRFPKGQQEQAEKMLTVIMSGFRTNPAWRDAVNGFWKSVRERKQVAHIGRIKMMDDQTRAMGEAAIRKGNERLADMDVQMRNWEQRQQSQDRIHTEFIKTIRGVENYQDASGKVELSGGYNHAWSRGDGSSFIMTNNSTFDPSSVFQDQQWKEMKKVD